MNTKSKLIIAGAVLAVLPVYLSAPGRSAKEQRAVFSGRNIAHRGLHEKDKSVPENSLAAFARAAENGYGMELDVQLSKDGEVVVFHDDTLDRVCGVHSRVDAKTLAELKELPLCGTNERIPLFTEMLELVDGRTPLIVELKTGPRNRELCEKTLEILRSYKGEYCIESFDPFIVAWFRFHAPEILRGQLAAGADDYKNMPKAEVFALSNCLLNFISRPQFIAYQLVRRPLTVRLSELLGAMRVCWTSHDPKDQKGQDTVIFEFYRPGIRFK